MLKTLVSDLEKELKTKGESLLQFSVGVRVTRYSCVLFAVNENSVLEAEVRTLQRKLIKRDGQILKQERELHKLRVGLCHCDPQISYPHENILNPKNIFLISERPAAGQQRAAWGEEWAGGRSQRGRAGGAQQEAGSLRPEWAGSAECEDRQTSQGFPLQDPHQGGHTGQ